MNKQLRLGIVWRLEHVDDVPRRISDSNAATEVFIDRLAHGLNTIRNQCSVSSVRIVNYPPEFNALVRRNASLFLQREYSAHASLLLEMYKGGVLIFHDKAQFFGIESTSLFDIGYM